MILETKRLILRPWTQADAPALYELARDASVGPPAGWPPHQSEADSLRVIREILAVPETFAIVRRADGALLGSIGFFPNTVGRGREEPEIGYWIGRPYWGQGYCPEAVEKLLWLCFRNGAPRVWCNHYEGNDKSRRVIEKCGFTFEDREAQYVPQMDETRVAVYYSLRREDWKGRED